MVAGRRNEVDSGQGERNTRSLGIPVDGMCSDRPSVNGCVRLDLVFGRSWAVSRGVGRCS